MVGQIQHSSTRELGYKWLNRQGARLRQLHPRPEKGVTLQDENDVLKLVVRGHLGYRIVEPLMMMKWRQGFNAWTVCQRALQRLRIT